jgi:hypothetical protein
MIGRRRLSLGGVYRVAKIDGSLSGLLLQQKAALRRSAENACPIA